MCPTFLVSTARWVPAAQLIALSLSEEHQDLVTSGSFLLENLHRVGFDWIIQIIVILSPGDFLTPAAEMLVSRTHRSLQCHPVSDGRQGVY